MIEQARLYGETIKKGGDHVRKSEDQNRGEGVLWIRPDAEGDAVNLDFISNGFKLRTTTGAHNASGGSYIYMCFAENPLVGTNNIPATAR